MSRAYRIRVRESDSRVIRAADAVCADLGMLDILPAEEMAQLLADELRGRGFKDDGKLLRRDGDGINVSVDLAAGTVTVSSEKCDEVEIASDREGLAYNDVGPAVKNVRERLIEQAKEDLNRIAAHEERKLQQKATEHLEKELLDLKRELDQAINRVTADALKRKAAQLGHIKEIQEDTDGNSLTIRVEV